MSFERSANLCAGFQKPKSRPAKPPAALRMKPELALLAKEFANFSLESLSHLGISFVNQENVQPYLVYATAFEPLRRMAMTTSISQTSSNLRMATKASSTQVTGVA